MGNYHVYTLDLKISFGSPEDGSKAPTLPWPTPVAYPGGRCSAWPCIDFGKMEKDGKIDLGQTLHVCIQNYNNGFGWSKAWFPVTAPFNQPGTVRMTNQLGAALTSVYPHSRLCWSFGAPRSQMKGYIEKLEISIRPDPSASSYRYHPSTVPYSHWRFDTMCYIHPAIRHQPSPPGASQCCAFLHWSPAAPHWAAPVLPSTPSVQSCAFPGRSLEMHQKMPARCWCSTKIWLVWLLPMMCYSGPWSSSPLASSLRPLKPGSRDQRPCLVMLQIRNNYLICIYNYIIL